MAKQENNIVMMFARGMLGGQVVFKQRAGITILAAPPRVNPNRVISAEEEETRDKFADVIKLAKAAIKNAVKKSQYDALAKPGQTAFNVAFTDAYHAPQVTNIIADEYGGAVGDLINVEATDNVKVDEVRVTVMSATNTIIESGIAIVNAEGNLWTYTATQTNANIPGSKIIATAKDIAGNIGTLEESL